MHQTLALKNLSNFCKISDILIHDAQYTQKDMPKKENWDTV